MPECAINSLRVHLRHIKVSLIYLAIWELSLSSLAIASQAKLAQSSLTSDQSVSYLNTVEDLLLWREDCKVAEGCRKLGGSGRWLRFSVYRCEKVELIMGNVSMMKASIQGGRMNAIRTKILCTLVMILAITIVALSPKRADGQAIPTTNRGWIGLKSGTQPPPGQYVTFLVWNYNYDTLVTNDGTQITSASGSVNQLVPAFGYAYVSGLKILGGNYSAQWYLPLANTAIDFPRLNASTDWGGSDMYIQPIQLGWHYKHADLVAGYALYMPTGRFTAGSFNNTGLGQWSNEFSGGFTVYPSSSQIIHLSTLVQYYIESGKRGSDQKVGDSLQLQGGAGVGFKDGLINAGMAYLTQWKVTEDRVPSNLPAFRGKDRYLGFGPEFNTVLPISEKTPVFAKFRYIFETGNRVATQGDILFFALTIAIPSKK
jgi:hypothetical protein